MDDVRFDALVRSLPMSSNRRGAFAALLGGALGGISLIQAAARKKSKKKKKCRCRGGRKRLSNGSCAKVCDDASDCALACACPTASIEGARYSTADVGFDCTKIPQSCSTTAQCLLGQYCRFVQLCGSNRCTPLCG